MTSFLLTLIAFMVILILLRMNKNKYYNLEEKSSLKVVDFFLDLILALFLSIVGLGIYQFFSYLQRALI